MNFFGLNKSREYTEQQLKFLEALKDPDNRGDLKTCRKVAGYGDHSPVSSIIKSLHQEIVNIARDMLCSNAVKASWAINDAIDNPDPLSPIRTQNAERILDRVGLGKGEKVTIDSGPSRIAILPARKKESD